MDWRTQYSPRQRVYAHPGDPVKILYSPQVDKQGHLELIESGTEDLYEYIQSHALSVDINTIIARYQRGDVDALERVQGLYADVTGLPKTYAEMLNVVIQGEHAFESLPLEVRAKFNHSYYEWMAAMDDFAGFAERMGMSFDTESAAGSAVEQQLDVAAHAQAVTASPSQDSAPTGQPAAAPSPQSLV